MTILEECELPKINLGGNAITAVTGQMIPHEKRLEIMSEHDWEDVTLEYADALRNRSEYVNIFKIAGSGDKGRDIVALCKEPLQAGQWDCYQCKHYDQPLSLSVILLEFGKLCYYTYNGSFPAPRKYYLVSPKGVGPELTDILTIPQHDKIRHRLIAKWSDECKTLSLLTKELKAYIEKFNFSVVSFVPQQDIISTLLKSRWGIVRFGGCLPPRPIMPNLRGFSIEQEQKLLYIQALIDAYNDHKKSNDLTLDNLEIKVPDFYKHLLQSRKSFHSAEALKRFSRSITPPGTFDELIKEIEDGISDVLAWPNHTGYERVLSSVKQAKTLPLKVSLLESWIKSLDREGICHHLANKKDSVVWVKK